MVCGEQPTLPTVRSSEVVYLARGSFRRLACLWDGFAMLCVCCLLVFFFRPNASMTRSSEDLSDLDHRVREIALPDEEKTLAVTQVTAGGVAAA